MERCLGLLEREWSAVPSIAAEWNTLSEDEQLFQDDRWSIAQSNLHVVRGWVEHGLLSRAQAQRYYVVAQLARESRSIIESLRGC